MPEFKVTMEGRHLGEPGTPETIGVHLRALPAADVIQLATKIMGVLEDLSPGPSFLLRQFRLLELFSPETAKRLDALLSATSGNGGVDILFYPAQLLTLMKLAASICAPGPPIGQLSAEQMSYFLLAAAQVTDVRDTAPGIGPDLDGGLMEGVIFSFRNAEQNRHVDVRAATGRAYQLWLRPSRRWPDSLQDPEAFAQQHFGVSLDQFVAVAAAPPLRRVQLDFNDPGSVLFRPETYFATTKVDVETARRVIDALTFAPVEGDPLRDQATYWSFADLADRPILRCGTDVRTVASLRYGLERATTGVFWMMHHSNEGNVGPFTEHFGHLFEDYCVNVAQGMAKATLAVRGDFDYGPKGRRTRTSDIVIATQSTRNQGAHVFVECRAGRPRLEVFEAGSVDAFGDYLDDIMGKLLQLDRSIRDYTGRVFDIDGDLARPGDTCVPMLVLDEPFQWTPGFGQLLDDRIAGCRYFRGQNVTKLVVCGLSEFEYLVGACEQGKDLLDLLLGYLGSNRSAGLDEYVASITGRSQIPRFTEQGWDAWTEMVKVELFGAAASGGPPR